MFTSPPIEDRTPFTMVSTLSASVLPKRSIALKTERPKIAFKVPALFAEPSNVSMESPNLSVNVSKLTPVVEDTN